MTPEEIRERVAARPDTETVQESYAWAAYWSALELQDAGVPSSVRAGVLVDFARAWEAAEAELAALTGSADDAPGPDHGGNTL